MSYRSHKKALQKKEYLLDLTDDNSPEGIEMERIAHALFIEKPDLTKVAESELGFAFKPVDTEPNPPGREKVTKIHFAAPQTAGRKDDVVIGLMDFLTQLAAKTPEGTGVAQRAIYEITRAPSPASEEFTHIAAKGILRGKYQPRPGKQTEYANTIRSNDFTFAYGAAGAGKDFIACAEALRALEAREVKHIILMRSAIMAGKDIGALPGTAEEKVRNFMGPFFDQFEELIGFRKMNEMIEQKLIKIEAVELARGRTLRHAFVLITEFQNTTEVQARTLLTRIGEGTKYVVTGDSSQIDLKPGRNGEEAKSGLVYAVNCFRNDNVERAGYIEFTSDDVERSAAAKRAVHAFEKAAQKEKQLQRDNKPAGASGPRPPTAC